MALEFIASTLLPRLLAASVQAVLVVAAIWLLCRLLPRLAPAVRALLWWLVALQLVVGVVWSSPLALPLLPAEVTQVAPPTDIGVVPVALANTSLLEAGNGFPTEAAHADAFDWHWPMAFALAWLLGFSVMVTRTLAAYLATRRLLRESQPCGDRNLLHALQLAAEAHGLRRTPRLRLSAAIDSPQLIGPWQPVLLLPAHHLDVMHADELDMALTHELVHLQRGDLWWGLLPAAAQHLFFFHPLAHLAAHEYALAREAACDAAVIAGNRHCAHDYGRLLVRLGVAPRPSAGLASASPTFRILKRRLVMLQNTASTPRIVALAIVGLVAVLGVMPYRITAAPAPAPAAPAARVDTQVAAIASVAPKTGFVATAAHAPVATVTATDAINAVAPVPPPPEAPVPPEPPVFAPPAPPAAVPAPPAPPVPPAPLTTRGVYTYVNNDDQAYVMLSGDETFAAGSSQDLRDAQRQRRGNEEMLWLRKGTARYVVRDPATLRKLQSLHDEMEALGAQQGRLGEQQGALGEQQGALGMRQAEISAQSATIAAQRAAQAATYAADRAANHATHDAGVAVARANAAKSEREAALQAQQRGMSEQMQFLAKRQQALGREQAALGARQAEISARTVREAGELLKQAIRNGVAQPVNQ